MLKPVVSTDLKSLSEIAEITLTASVPLPGYVLEDVIMHTKKNISLYLDSENCAFLKYEEKSKIIGFILIKEYWNLSDLYVLPQYQGKGVGSELLLQGLTICRLHSHTPTVRLNSSMNAVRFYSKHGFSEANKSNVASDYSVTMEYYL